MNLLSKNLNFLSKNSNFIVKKADVLFLQSENIIGRVAVRTEDKQIKVFVELKEEGLQEQSDIITDDRWKSLHSNQVTFLVF